MCFLKTSEGIQKNCTCQFTNLCKRHQQQASEQENFCNSPTKQSLFNSNISPTFLSHIIIDKDINSQSHEPSIKTIL
jgi:hypothetical protein